ncbi:MAG TPA: 1,4-dihydroxy-6-naphthoate synthase [Chitinophagaceae bacterium]
MKFTLGFSPCPNDTFIFDALVNGKMDIEGFTFEPVLEDVETLNKWALEGRLDITKLSFPALFRSSAAYDLLNCGSALGKGVGPLLISRIENFPEENIMHSTVAIPGLNTTANLLFTFAFPQVSAKKFMVFSAIEDAVLNGEADLGVIIHENRFTYRDKGLHKVCDLGALWEEQMKVPIPLGAIAIRSAAANADREKITNLIRRSLQYSFDRYPVISDYVKAHAQTMSETVMRQHIDLYVNNYTLDLGEDGRYAIETLKRVFGESSHTAYPQSARS